MPEAVERWIRFYEAERDDGEEFNAFVDARRDQGASRTRVRDLALPIEFGLETMDHFIDWTQERPVRGHPRRGRMRSLSPHLEQLEAEAIHVIREVAAELENPVVLFSGGKDSIVLLALAEKAFAPAPLPFAVMHVDTGHNFPEAIEFRDRARAGRDRGLACRSRSTRAASSRRPARAPRATGCRRPRCSTRSPSTASTPRSAAPAATRSAPAPRSACSPSATTSASGTRASQRPELWDLYNGRVRRGEHVRVFPLSNWTELDVWEYILAEELEIPALYVAHEREVFERDGMLYAVSDFVERMDGEEPFTESVRYRTVGDMTCTGAVRSHGHLARGRRGGDRGHAGHRARRDARRRPRVRGRHGRPQASRAISRCCASPRRAPSTTASRP